MKNLSSFKKSIATNTDIPPHSIPIKHKLAITVAQEMIPIYEKMSAAHLIKRMEKGKTQN